MEASEFLALRKTVKTRVGDVSYVEQGNGPVALFVHGVLMNAAIWRHVIEQLRDERRCVAVEILGHGGTPAAPDTDMSLASHAGMLEAFAEAMKIDKLDLVANDSGGGIAQIFAAEHPERIRTLTLTNCDTHDNYPPPALEGFVNLARNGQMGATIRQTLDDREFANRLLGTAYARPEQLSDATIRAYLEPWTESEASTKNLERFMTSMDNTQNTRIEPKLRQLRAPALIVWATDDVFFDKKWAYWLKDTLPGATEVIELPGEKLFFPEERPKALVAPLRALWKTAVAA